METREISNFEYEKDYAMREIDAGYMKMRSYIFVIDQHLIKTAFILNEFLTRLPKDSIIFHILQLENGIEWSYRIGSMAFPLRGRHHSGVIYVEPTYIMGHSGKHIIKDIEIEYPFELLDIE